MTGAESRPRVVVVGAGFAGMFCARALRRAPVEVTVVDENNYHLFTPLLYQVASALLDPSEVAQPVRTMLRRVRNAEFRLARVDAVDLSGRRVVTSMGDLVYDYLVLAPGSVPAYYGIPGLAEHAFALKSLGPGLALRNHVLRCFEVSRWVGSDSIELRRALLRFVVIGGGPTGVEYSGALSELFGLVVGRDYGRAGRREVSVHLVEGDTRLLLAFEESLGAYAAAALTRLGVTVACSARVLRVEPSGSSVFGVPLLRVVLSDGSELVAGTVVAAAGVQGSPLGAGVAASAGLTLGPAGRLPVLPSLQLSESFPSVFVCGDLALTAPALPMLAPVAIQQGVHAARAIGALVADGSGGASGSVAPFVYRDRGIMATIGRDAAVVQAGRFRLTGLAGWVFWLVVHLANIISFRNRLIVLLNWAWDYVFYDRPVRLILRAGRD